MSDMLILELTGQMKAGKFTLLQQAQTLESPKNPPMDASLCTMAEEWTIERSFFSSFSDKVIESFILLSNKKFPAKSQKFITLRELHFRQLNSMLAYQITSLFWKERSCNYFKSTYSDLNRRGSWYVWSNANWSKHELRYLYKYIYTWRV